MYVPTYPMQRIDYSAMETLQSYKINSGKEKIKKENSLNPFLMYEITPPSLLHLRHTV